MIRGRIVNIFVQRDMINGGALYSLKSCDTKITLLQQGGTGACALYRPKIVGLCAACYHASFDNFSLGLIDRLIDYLFDTS